MQRQRAVLALDVKGLVLDYPLEHTAVFRAHVREIGRLPAHVVVVVGEHSLPPEFIRARSENASYAHPRRRHERRTFA